jgi:hypothetical protein
MKANEFINEGGGYIPQNEEEALDPRFSMAITCDIHPGEDVKQSAKLGFKLEKGGRPPLLKSNGKISESSEKYTKKTDFRFKNGALLMQRVGEINAQKQIHSGDNVPPVKRGMWAFPYPAMDKYFAAHKMESLFPVNLRTTSIMQQWDKAKEEGRTDDAEFKELYASLWDKRRKLENTLKPKLKEKMRIKTFWWSGPIYSHIAPKGMKDENKSWYLWTDLKAWAKEANKSMVCKTDAHKYGVKINPTEQGFMTYSVDHIELFLPQKAEITHQVKSNKITESTIPCYHCDGEGYIHNFDPKTKTSSGQVCPFCKGKLVIQDISDYRKKETTKINHSLNFLEKQPAIAWDMVGTLVMGPASDTLRKFIMDHPNIKHYLITSEPDDGLLRAYIEDDFKHADPKFSINLFQKIIGADPVKYKHGIRQFKLRNMGYIEGPMTSDEAYVKYMKSIICKNIGVSILVDDDQMWEEGCEKYGVTLISPYDCI